MQEDSMVKRIRAEGGCLGTRKAKKVVVSCEKPRGAASKL